MIEESRTILYEIMKAPKMDAFREVYNTFMGEDLEEGDYDVPQKKESEKQQKSEEPTIRINAFQQKILDSIKTSKLTVEGEQILRMELALYAPKDKESSRVLTITPDKFPPFVSKIPSKSVYISDFTLKANVIKKTSELTGGVLQIPIIELLSENEKLSHLLKDTKAMTVDSLHIVLKSYSCNKSGSVQVYTIVDKSKPTVVYANLGAMAYNLESKMFRLRPNDVEIRRVLPDKKQFKMTEVWLRHASKSVKSFESHCMRIGGNIRITKNLETMAVMSHLIYSKGEVYNHIYQDQTYYILEERLYYILESDLDFIFTQIQLADVALCISPLCHNRWQDMFDDDITKLSEVCFRVKSTDQESDDSSSDDEEYQEKEHEKISTALSVASQSKKTGASPVTIPIDQTDTTTEEYLNVEFVLKISFRVIQKQTEQKK